MEELIIGMCYTYCKKMFDVGFCFPSCQAISAKGSRLCKRCWECSYSPYFLKIIWQPLSWVLYCLIEKLMYFISSSLCMHREKTRTMCDRANWRVIVYSHSGTLQLEVSFGRRLMLYNVFQNNKRNKWWDLVLDLMLHPRKLKFL